MGMGIRCPRIHANWPAKSERALLEQADLPPTTHHRFTSRKESAKTHGTKSNRLKSTPLRAWAIGQRCALKPSHSPKHTFTRPLTRKFPDLFEYSTLTSRRTPTPTLLHSPQPAQNRVYTIPAFPRENTASQPITYP